MTVDMSKVEELIEFKLMSWLNVKRDSQILQPADMLFQRLLVGSKRVALSSIVHSLSTMFGMSIYEQIAKQISLDSGKYETVESQYSIGNELYTNAQNEITDICNQISTEEIQANHHEEVRRIINASSTDSGISKKDVLKVDLLLINSDDRIVHLFDLKTAKPSKKDFGSYKQMLLEWVAAYICENRSTNDWNAGDWDIRASLAIPYNPNYPNNYNWWTLRMLDENQIMVGADFWNYIAGDESAFSELIDCFTRVSERLSPMLESYLAEVEEQYGEFDDIYPVQDIFLA